MNQFYKKALALDIAIKQELRRIDKAIKQRKPMKFSRCNRCHKV